MVPGELPAPGTSQARADSDLSLQSSSDLRAAEEKLRAAMAEIEALKKGSAKVEVSHAMKMKQLRDELEQAREQAAAAADVGELRDVLPPQPEEAPPPAPAPAPAAQPPK